MHMLSQPRKSTSACTSRILRLAALVALLAASAGCKPLFDIRKAMYDQEKFEPLEKTDFFGDSRSARPLIDGTVAQGELRLDDHLYLGIDEDAKPVQEFPFEITAHDLDRGEERYNIYCSVCHGKAGHGQGMVVRRGYKEAPAFHSDRLREQPVGYIYGVINNGYGDMGSYADQIKPEDRWRIVAYIKALQRSQHASKADVEFAANFKPSENTSDDHKDEHH